MTGGYDGEIRIRTLIENGKATSQLLQLEARFQKLTSEAKKLSDGMHEIEQMKISAEEYKNLQSQFDALVEKGKRLSETLKGTEKYIPTEEYKNLKNTFDALIVKGEKLSEKLKDTEKYVPSREYLETEKALDSVSAKQDHLRKKMEEWVALGKKTNSTSYKKMEMDFETLGQQADRLIMRLNEMDEKGQDKTISAKWQETKDKMTQVEQETASVREQMIELEQTGRDKTISEKWQEIRNEMSQAGKEASKTKARMRDMEADGTANVDPKSTAEYQKKAEKLKEVNRQLDVTKRKMEEVAAREAKVGSKNIEKVGKAAKKSANLMTTFLSRLKGIVLSLFIFNWITKGFNAMVSAFQDGIQSMAKYSKDFNLNMSEMKSATSTLRASIGTLAVPILSQLIPAIVTLCTWLTNAINAMNRFISAVSGKSTWTRAKKQQVDYAKSLDKTSSAAKKAAGALASFDELNVINTNSSGGGGSSGSGTDAGGYEEVALTEKDFEWVDKIKNKIQPVTDALKNLYENGLMKLKDFGYDALLGFYEHFLVPVGNWALGEGLPRLIDAFNDGLMEIDFTKITDALNDFWDALAPFAINVGEGLLWFWENVLVPLGTWTANEVVPRFLETVSKCIDILNTVIEALQPTFQWFWDNVLQPIAQWAADKFLEAWDAINEALTIFGDWCEEHETVIQTIAIILVSLGIAIGIVSAAIAIWNAVGTIATIVTTGFAAAIAFLTSPITLVIIAITALIAIGILLYQHWDEIKEKATEIWEKIKEIISEKIDAAKEKIHKVIENIKAFWSEKWEWIKSKVTEIWNNITSAISNKITFIKDKITQILNNIKTIWNNIWTNMKTSVIDIFNGIWNGIKGIINNIISGIEKMANSVIDGINAMIASMNTLSWDIPNWVPKIGGNKFGLNIPTLSNVSIPRLANGGITTGSTLANIGEAGREAVLPLENNLSYMEPFAEMIASKLEGVQVVKIIPDESGIVKVVREGANDYYRRTGRPLFDF